MKISDRDKKLLLIVVLAAIILLPIFLFIKPKKEATVALDNELVGLNDRLNYLKDLDAKRPTYEAEILRLNSEREDMIKCYAQGLLQENTIMFLRDIELDLPVAMYAETFSEYVTTPVTSGTVNPETQQVEGDLTAVTTSTSVAYSSKYDQIKDFLNYIFTYSDKMSISSINMAYDNETGLISGSFTVNEFAFVGSGRSVDPVVLPTLQRGNESVFATLLPAEAELEEVPEVTEETDENLETSEDTN